jgi:hypothetical protein
MTFKLLHGGRLLSMGLGIGLAWACTVSDKSDFKFEDPSGGSGGSSASGGKGGKGSAGSAGRGGAAGNGNFGGESGEAGQTGQGGQGDGGQGTSGKGGSGGLPACDSGEARCEGVCIDVQEDNANCGDCDAPCEATEVCVAGVCELDCRSTETLCDGVCVDISVNPDYCGNCMTQCPTGQACNMGVCSLDCDGLTNCDGACVDLTNNAGFCGDCAVACQNNTLCVESACDCAASGFTGATCSDDIDECEGDPCQNGGSCRNFAGGYSCDCTNTGYTGTNCDVDVNECDNDPCQNGTRCNNTDGGYSCDCGDSGYTGTNCQTDIDECEDDPCQNDGECDNEPGSYSCDCSGTGYTGTNCQTDVNECANNPCQNGGECDNDQGSYTCDCAGTGYTGTNCQTDINECQPTNPCQNGGTCNNTGGSYTCSCTGGFTPATQCRCRGTDTFGSSGCVVKTACGHPTNPTPTFASANCSTNTSEFANWWCQLAGYEAARSYTELTSSVVPALYYNGGSNTEVLSQCSQTGTSSGYGFAASCTGVQNLVCQPRPISNALRTSVMVCGSSSYAVSGFFPSGSGLTATTGCTPTSATQAMMFTRTATGYTGSTLRTYLNNGGIIMTEYSFSDEIWNTIFPAATPAASAMGSCFDNVPQLARFNATDPFWVNNTWASGQMLAETGCGHPVQSFPFIVPLGGWDATNVAFGYRNIGMGRFWVTDFDWQDSQAKAAYTVSQMGYMITHRR